MGSSRHPVNIVKLSQLAFSYGSASLLMLHTIPCSRSLPCYSRTYLHALSSMILLLLPARLCLSWTLISCHEFMAATRADDDELGFVAAAKWYTDGFAERSGIKINLQLSNQTQRLTRTVELPLFRILQASLSNVHRHAESPSVDVRFTLNEREARLEVKDCGKGIDSELLRRLNDKRSKLNKCESV